MPPATQVRLPSPVRIAIAAGAVVVTPNKRMARHLVALHDREQRAEGHTVWPAPTIVPWSAWLERLWLDVLSASCHPDPARRVTPAQSAFLWSRLVAAEGLPLMDERGAADLAAKAWSLVHAWGAGGPSWRGWSDGADDVAIFARWAESYRAALARLSALDDAELPDWLASCAAEVPAWRTAATALVGFIEYSPQQERLLGALRDAGMRLVRHASLPEEEGAIGRARRTEGATPRDEIARALTWARDRVLADSNETVAIAIVDLQSRRAEVRALAEEILSPALQWPGREGAPRPYNISLGDALADVPMVTTALDLIALAQAPLPIARAAALLRSPYVAGGHDDFLRRAAVERTWLREGQREISLTGVVAAVGAGDAAFPPLQRVVDASPKPHGSMTPRAWVEAWRDLLEAAGWPGTRGQSSVEWQARKAWDEKVAEFARLGLVAPRMQRGEAHGALVALARSEVFQPESSLASVQILGALEATGLEFDGLWVAGLAAENWPPAPEPNPLLSLAWQRDRNVPRSTATRELDYAQALVKQWATAAREVVFSHAVTEEDHPRTITSMVTGAKPWPGTEACVTTTVVQFTGAPPLDALADDSAPPLPIGSRMRGGAGLIAAQSDCPFRAMTLYRFRADTWPVPLDGFSALERGILVHAALATFWRDVTDHATLIALTEDELRRRIDRAAREASQCLTSVRWSRLPPVVAAGEAQRLARIVRTWVDDFERPRPPFVVSEVEVSRPLALNGLELSLRVDRIDALAGGGIAIIDYKTGFASPPYRWFDERPEAPQLGLYWQSQRAIGRSLPVRALVYAQLRPGELKAVGLAEEESVWPRLSRLQTLRAPGLEDWQALDVRWRETLGALALEVRAGHAAVAPRDVVETCRRCGLQPLCRIGTAAGRVEVEDGDG